MPKKYSIVRVDGECPKGFNEDIYCKWCGNCGRLYGDTKEQLIRKIATAIFRREVKAYKKYYGIEPMKIITRDAEAQCLKVAKEIVEFLGVEE